MPDYSIELGINIKKFRTGRKMSLRQLAEASGVSASQLSKIESGKGDTTVTNLIKIARVLRIPVSELVGSSESNPVLRPLSKGEGFAISRQGGAQGFREIFLNMRPDAAMQPEIMFMPPGTTSGSFLTHEGEEFFYILKGSARFFIADEIFDMHEGDSFYFKCTIPHMWENLSNTCWCELLVCCSPPVFR